MVQIYIPLHSDHLRIILNELSSKKKHFTLLLLSPVTETITSILPHTLIHQGLLDCPSPWKAQTLFEAMLHYPNGDNMVGPNPFGGNVDLSRWRHFLQDNRQDAETA